MGGELAEGTVPNVAGFGRELPLLSPSLKEGRDADSRPGLLLLRTLPFREGLKERVGAVVPLSELHRALLERVRAAGLGDADNAAIIRAFER